MFPTRQGARNVAGATQRASARVHRVLVVLLALVLTLQFVPLSAMAETAQGATDAQGTSEGAAAPGTRATSGESGDGAGDAAGRTGTNDGAGTTTQTEDGGTEDDAAPAQDTAGQPTGQGSSEDGSTSAPATSSKEEATTPGAEAATINVSVRVIGPDAEGHNVDWLPATNVTVAATATGFDATKAALDKGGLTYDVEEGTPYGTYLTGITSPYTNQTLTYDASTREYWSLLVGTGSDLAHSEVGISSIDMSTVKEIVWYYSTGTDVPAEAPDAEPSSTPLPTSASDWSGFQQVLGDQKAATPTDTVKVAWDVDLSRYGSSGPWHKVSELLSVNGFIYAAVDDRVVRINEETGAVDDTVGTLEGSISYTSRPLYVNGMIVVALEDGRVEALNATTLKKRWVTPIMDKGCQSSCSLSLTSGSNPQIVVGISQGSGTAGMLLTIDPSTGSSANYRVLDQSQASGWYWSGGASVGGYLITADTAGRVSVYRTSDGTTVANHQLTSDVPGGSTVNADVVALGEEDFLVATRDGRLHRMRLTNTNGTIGIYEVSSVSLGGTGKAAPVVSGGTALIGGTRDATGASPAALYVVDTSTMSLLQTITKADGLDLLVGQGGISAPALVSTTPAGTFAYFTVNAATFDASAKTYTSGGNLYVYRLGAAEAHLLYAPTDNAEFCDSPVICDAQGGLYYLNDSSHVVRLVSGTGGTGSVDTDRNVAADSASVAYAGGSLAGLLASANGIGRGATTGHLAFGATMNGTAAGTQGASGLLSGASSDVLTGTTAAGGPSSAGQGDAPTDATRPANLSAWPVVGAGLGVALLGATLVGGHRRRGRGA